MTSEFRLDSSFEPKAARWARTLRRCVLNYWYSTMEGPQAAAGEAALATIAVNTLDEAVFEAAFGDPYRKHRSDDVLGRVVMGLELIRNCEIHSHVDFEFEQTSTFGVPPNLGYRTIFVWPSLEKLPPEYRQQQAGEHRARGEARDGYRRWVAGRPVIETLLDAIAFFDGLGDGFSPAQPIDVSYAIDLAPIGPNGETVACRPMGLDNGAILLPDLACRAHERRSPSWPAADQWLKEERKKIKKELPGGNARVVNGTVYDEQGRLIALTGMSATLPQTGFAYRWIERAKQVARDVRGGYSYFVVHNGSEVHLSADDQLNLEAIFDEVCLLDRLQAEAPARVLSSLALLEDHPDLYRRERLFGS